MIYSTVFNQHMDFTGNEEAAFTRKELKVALVGMQDDFFPAMIFNTTVLDDDKDLKERISAYHKDL